MASKKIMLIISLIFVVILIAYNIIYKYSDRAKIGEKVAKNIRLIKIGMDTTRVNDVMNVTPKHITYFTNPSKEIIYHYDAGFEYSNSYQIKFDKNYKVIEVSVAQ